MWLFAVCHQLLSLQFLENFSIFLRHLSWWGWCCLQHWKSMWIEVYCGVYVIQNSYHWLCRKQLNGINLVSQVDEWRDACVLCTLLALWHDINDNHCHEHQNNLHQRIVQSAFNWQWRMEILPRMYIVASHVWELTSQNHLCGSLHPKTTCSFKLLVPCRSYGFTMVWIKSSKWGFWYRIGDLLQ